MSIASKQSDGPDAGGQLMAGPWQSVSGGHEDTPGPTLPQESLASVGRALQNIFECYSGSAVRRIVGVSDEYGIDGLYVAFIVMRERTAWPAMRSAGSRSTSFSAATAAASPSPPSR